MKGKRIGALVLAMVMTASTLLQGAVPTMASDVQIVYEEGTSEIISDISEENTNENLEENTEQGIVDTTEEISDESLQEIAENAAAEFPEEMMSAEVKEELYKEAAEAETGTLQALINAAVETAETNDDAITLAQNCAENIVIPDGANITIDLNGFALSPDATGRVIDETTINTINVFGNLTLSNGKLTNANSDTNVRGIYVDYKSSLTLDKVTIDGFTTNGNGAGIYGAKYAQIAITDSTITNGSASSGGGIFAGIDSLLSLTKSNITKNTSSISGGGIYTTGAQLNIDSSSISNNTATVNGGGVYTDAIVVMADSEIDNNTLNGEKSRGGGLYLGKNATFTMSGGSVNNNVAYYGGGIYSACTVANAIVLSGTAEIDSNQSTMNGGGILLSPATATMVVKENAVISNNKTAHGTNSNYRGGGIYTSGIVEVQGGKMYGNVAYDGGAIAGTVVMTGGQLYENLSYHDGGAIFGNSGTHKMNLSSGEIYNNQANHFGGGLFSTYNVTVDGTTRIHHNTAARGGGICAQNGCKVYLKGGILSDNYASAYGGGICHFYDGSNYESKFELTGTLVYKNTVGTAARGNDISIMGGTDINHSVDLSLCAPSDIHMDGAVGIGWYNEKFETTTTTAISKSGNYVGTGNAPHFAYTLLYTDTVAQIGETTYSTVQAAVNAISDKSASDHTVKMIKDSNELVVIPENVTVKLDLNGYTLQEGTTAGSVITVKESANLTITDSSTEQTGTITGGTGTQIYSNTNTYGGALLVYGEATLEKGIITGVKAKIGAVYVAGDGKFTMNGGTICDNPTVGVQVNSIGQESCTGSFEMKGGEITGNISTVYGGGVSAANGGTFTMTNGKITENYTGQNGGGIYLINANATITGGEISFNSINADSTYNGGGIYSNASNLTISNAKIVNNIAGKGDGSASCKGGGIWAQAGSLTITDSEIHSNTCLSETSNDIYIGTSVKVSIEKVTDMPSMTNASYNAWYDGKSNIYISEAIDSASTETAYYLTATTENITAVARIKDTKYTTLQAAVNASKNGDIIYLIADVCERVYVKEATNATEFVIDLNGYTLSTEQSQAIYVYNVALTITDTSQTTPQGDAKEDSAGGMIVPAEGNTNARAIYANYGSITLEGGTIKGFHCSGSGGAIYLDRVSFYMTGGKIAYNTSDVAGGAIYAKEFNDKELSLIGGSIENNTAPSGGGVYFLGNANNERMKLILDGIRIVNNTANNGGGLYINGKADVTEIKGNTIIENNSASKGGGVYLLYSSSSTAEPMTVSGGSIKGNNAKDGGGGIWVQAGNLEMTGGQITENKVDSTDNAKKGGGIYVEAAGTVKLVDGEISENAAPCGGGIALNACAYFEMSGGRIAKNQSYATGAYGGGGVFLSEKFTKALFSGGTIENNESLQMGGGVELYGNNQNQTIVFDGTEILNNVSATNGGGICINKSMKTVTIQGDTLIEGNEGKIYGGGVYVCGSASLLVSGGKITKNKSPKGGGVYVVGTSSSLDVNTTGKVYDNIAELGHDVYVADDGAKTTTLKLMKASEMMADMTNGTDYRWYDEQTGDVHEEAISYGKTVRSYAFSLKYNSTVSVAKIGNKEFTSVQAACDAIVAAKNSGDWSSLYGTSEVPEQIEIVMIADSKENVIVPAAVDATLNLNGHVLSSVGTTIVCDGDLMIEDDPLTDGSAGSDIGTITGVGYKSGGGITVRAGGYVKMISGQISNCLSNHDGVSSSTFGGGGVYVYRGTFELDGTASINNCKGHQGGAVFVYDASSTFIMNGGTIENNTTLQNGAVYVNGGLFRMRGGVIQNNTAKDGGAVFVYAGKAILSGSENKQPQILNNTVTENGGGVYLNSGRIELRNVLISNNTTTTAGESYGLGGGVYQAGGTIKMYDGTLINENLSRRGGGIYMSGGTFNMYGGVVTANRGYYGGGLAQKTDATPAFNMHGGAIYGNQSVLTGTGNDIYSAYEGTGTYPSNTTVPKATLIAASEMGLADYNVWRDDSYNKDVKEAESILNGLNITGPISKSLNLQLTATKYGDTTAEELTTTYKTNSLKVTSITDGTATFDKSQEVIQAEVYDDEKEVATKWSPGDDSNASNGVVRSYDAISYNLSLTMGGEGQGQTGTNEVINVWLEAEIPYDSSQVGFTTPDSVKFFDIEEITDAQGKVSQKLRMCWEETMTGDNTAATRTKSITLNVYGMSNGEIIQPTFSTWVGGNENNESKPPTCTANKVVVSAAPRYNVLLLRNSELTYTGYFNLNTGLETTSSDPNAIYGTMLGYGVTLELYNDSNKDLKGIELPEGEITFDMELKGNIYLNGDVLSYTDGTPVYSTPYIWAYKENEKGTTGNNLQGNNHSVNMDWNDEDDLVKSTSYAFDAAPFNSGNNTSSCYSGGAWNMSGSQPTVGATSTKVTFTVDGYSFASPIGDVVKSQSGSSDTGNNSIINSTMLEPFSAGYVQVLYPIDKAEIKEVAGEEGGYVQIYTESVVSKLQATSVSGQSPKSTTTGIEQMTEFYGEELVAKYAINEMQYADNYLGYPSGLYISDGTNANTLAKTNYFANDENGQKLDSGSGANGDASTPISSVVRIGANVTFGSQSFNIAENADYDPQTQNPVEYNYLTAFDLLQKFDGDVFTPTSSAEVVNQRFDLSYSSNKSIDGFLITNNESATVWDDTEPYTTNSYNLTILYAAKPDGTNWVKDSSMPGSMGGEAQMDQYRDDDLIYFTTLKDLYNYFGYEEDGVTPKGTCVGILYQFRNCCVRNNRKFTIESRMQVTDEFAKTGGTYCTTNDVKGWYTYRPTYKTHYAAGTLNTILNDFIWSSVVKETRNGVTAYGLGNNATSDDLPTGYVTTTDDTGMVKNPTYETIEGVTDENDYIKTEYVNGNIVQGTHTGWASGNTVLLYTLDSNIIIQNTDLQQNSNSIKSHYYVNNGERLANFRIVPDLQPASETKNHELVMNGSQATEVLITLTLPKHLTYRDGSLNFDYSVDGCEYQDGEMSWDVEVMPTATDGTTQIIFKTYVNDIEKGLPAIEYSATIGDPQASVENDVTNGANLITTATIRTTYSETSQIASTVQKDTATIVAVRENGDSIYKDVEKNLVELGEDLVFELYYSNTSDSVNSIELYDILPYNNDTRSTSFTGGYAVKEIQLIFDHASSYTNFNNDGWLSYKTGVAVTQVEANQKTILDEALGKTTGDESTDSGSDTGTETTTSWTKIVSGELDDTNKTVTYDLTSVNLVQYAKDASGNAINTGIGVYGNLPNIKGETGVKIKITLSPLDASKSNETTKALLQDGTKNGQTGNNVYWNNFVYRSGSNVPVMGGRVFVRTVSRTIAGLAWMDMDRDGKYMEGTSQYASDDQVLSGVDVYLYEKDASGAFVIAKDILGNEVKKITTGEDGSYTFTNLAEGNYYVCFQDDDKDYKVVDSTDGSEEANQPISFDKLSVTPVRDTKVYTMPGTTTDKAVPVYGVIGEDGSTQFTEDSAAGAASLGYAVINNANETTSGIKLPALADVGVGQYVSQHWNAGFYYKTLDIEKQWLNTSSIPSGTTVNIEMKASIPQGTGAVDYTSTFSFVQGESGVTAGKNNLLVDGTTTGWTTNGGSYSKAAVVTTNATNKEILWSLTDIPVQAEGAGGVITYTTVGEVAKDAAGNALVGYKQTLTMDVDDDGNMTVSAMNDKFVANKDQIVMDYGKDIQVDVLANDVNINDLADANYWAEPVGFAAYTAKYPSEDAVDEIPNDLPTTYEGNSGTFTLVTGETKEYNAIPATDWYGKSTTQAAYTLATGKVQYQLNKIFSEVEKVFVVVKVTNKLDHDDVFYMYQELDMIPATNVYYETDFCENVFTFTAEDGSDSDTVSNAWDAVVDSNEENYTNTTVENSTDNIQDDGTIGQSNHTYGYDSTYEDDVYLSDGSSYKVNGEGVDYTKTTFSFTGTGFDLYSRTGKDQGTIRVRVYKTGEMTTGQPVETVYVINKADSAWGELYQVPVVSIEKLDHGTYDVEISVYEEKRYTGVLESLSRGNEFYFDAVRIYDPVDVTNATAGSDAKIALNAYLTDGQALPQITEVRDILISANDANINQEGTGAMFIELFGDGAGADDTAGTTGDTHYYSLADYKAIGPNNEVYLSPGQAIVFKISGFDLATVASIDIGAKATDGDSVAMQATISKTPIAAEGTSNTIYVKGDRLIQSTSAQYYDLLHGVTDTTAVIAADSANTSNGVAYVMISNPVETTGNDDSAAQNKAILSITDLKIAYKSANASATTVSYNYDASLLDFANSVEMKEANYDIQSAALTDEKVNLWENGTFVLETTQDVERLEISNGKGLPIYANITYEDGMNGIRIWTIDVKMLMYGLQTFTITGYGHKGTAGTTELLPVMVDFQKGNLQRFQLAN